MKRLGISLVVMASLGVISGCMEGQDSESVLSTSSSSNSTKETNGQVSDGLTINEIKAQQENDDADWIELKNNSTADINLAGYTLEDNSGSVSSLPDITIAPNEFYILIADDLNTQGHVNFKLGKEDSLLLKFEGQVIDSISWTEDSHSKKSAFGRYQGLLTELYPTKSTTNIPYTAFLKDKVIPVSVQLNADDWQSMLDTPLAEEYKNATLIYNNITVNNIAIRTKGNSSLSSVANDPDSIRYSFKLDFNYYDEDQKFLGLKKLNFNNNFSDPSMMRETLTYELLEEIGSTYSRTAYIDLTINDQHMGVYTAVEHIDSEYIERFFDNNDGDLYKADMGSTLEYKGDDIADYESYSLESNKDSSQKQALLSFIQSIENDNIDIGQSLQMEQFLKYLAVSTALVNLDSYQGTMAHNYYMYDDLGQMNILPWDFNMSFAGFSMSCSEEQLIDFYIDEPTVSNMSARPLIEKVLSNDNYKAQYHMYLQELISTYFTAELMSEKITNLANMLDPYVQNDPTFFYTYEEWANSLDNTIESEGLFNTNGGNGGGLPALDGMDIPEGFELPEGFSGMTPPENMDMQMPDQNMNSSVLGLRYFINKRIQSIQDQLNGVKTSANNGDGNCALQQNNSTDNIVNIQENKQPLGV